MFGKTKKVQIGNVAVGADFPVAVQSMTNTDTLDFDSTLGQVKKLADAGCDIVRIAVPSEEAAGIFAYVKKSGLTVPLVADIHFDYRIALASVRAGADKIRINPGNIGAKWKVEEVASACAASSVPIRIGVNGGSLDKRFLEKYSAPTPEALAESALEEAEVLESCGFSDIVISIKSSRTADMIKACRIVSAQSEHPLHIGVTEAGDEYSGLVKNCVGIGSLLSDGIGDTIRVSLTADPVREVEAGREILSALGLAKPSLHIVSCPTCGRTKINLIELSARFREEAKNFDTNGKDITVALMGCAVNGPGEAREADVGIAGGAGDAVLFRKGQIVGKVREEEIIPRLIHELNDIAENSI